MKRPQINAHVVDCLQTAELYLRADLEAMVGDDCQTHRNDVPKLQRALDFMNDLKRWHDQKGAQS